MLQLPPNVGSKFLPGFDYIAAYHECSRQPNTTDEAHGDGGKLELFNRILLAHGINLDSEIYTDSTELRELALNVVRGHTFEQRLLERKLGLCSGSTGSPTFEFRSGWEADVFLSNRRAHASTVLKVYRFHLLGGNPEHPGFGWVIDPQRIEAESSGARRLPDTHFAPNPTIEKLRSRFFRASRLPFWAQISSIYNTDHALFIEQERVSPVKEYRETELDRAAFHFLASHHGVYFTNASGDLKNVGSVDSAVIVHRSRFYLVQDYYYNLGYRLDVDGRAVLSAPPVMFDGHALPLTRRYVEHFPSLAHAVMLINSLYPHVPQDSEMVELARQRSGIGSILERRALLQTYNLCSVPFSVAPTVLNLPFDSPDSLPPLAQGAS